MQSSRKVSVYLVMLVMMLVLPFVFQPSLASPGPPVADFTYLPGTPVIGETVTFDASLSTPDGGTIVSYIWSFGDGSPIVVETDPVTTHQYTEVGIYSVSLVIVDSESEIDSTTKNVTVSAPASSLVVFAEAASFARLDDVDPSGWFYQAVLYNPTNESIIVTGLRWWYNSSQKLIDSVRSARCYDSRYFSGLPTASGTAGQAPSWAKWEYPADSVSVTVPAGEIIVTWIEVPTKSNNGGLSMSATYYVEAYDGNRWVSSPLYSTHGGTDDAVSTVFRADFNLATDPNGENQSHPNPQWLFNEDRITDPEATVRVRLIPITSSRGANKIDFATVNITLPSAWSYVSGSAYNPYAETITYFSIDGKDRLKWDLNSDVNLYSVDQSMAQNYIEFNVTAPQTPGIYNFTVNASITSDKGDTAPENQSIYVVVNSPPVASFTYSPEILIADETMTLNASLSYDSDGNIASYYWDFGDGSNGTGIITTHNYTSIGTYNITLTVTDNDNLTDSESKLIVVKKYPIAAFTYSPTVPLMNQIVTFNASLSTPDGGTITSYQWDFGDGNNVNETDPVTYHNYTIPGTYNVTLNITDSEGLWDIESKNITIVKYPLASFTYSPENPIVGETVTFDASLSTPNGGTLVNYFWDFGDGTNTTETDPITYHNFTMIGNYNVTLNVTDSEGLWDTESQIIPIAEFPTASFTYSPLTPITDETVTFNASLSTPNGGTIVSYHWNFGDGIEITETDPIAYHNYTTNGIFDVTLNVTDSEGLWDVETKPITIINYPTAYFTYSLENPLVGEAIIFNASLSTPNGGTITNYYWNFGDGTNDTEAIVAHAYTAAGNYTVSLTITDSEGLSDTENKSIIVEGTPVYIHDVSIISVTPSTTEVDLGQTVNITVVVKNEGNFTETFNVTLYYDNNIIETQTVTDLAPSGDKTLTFSWNTTGVTPDVNHTIKAEASTVQGETNTDNNANADSTIKVKGKVAPQPFDWAPILPYILPIILGSISFLIAGVIWKKRGPTVAGFEFFDEITGGGIPDRYATMIIGGANSGKSVLCQQLVHTYLSKEKPCIYVNYDSFPDEVRKNMKNFNWDTSTYEQKGTFKFVDCYSPIAGVTSKEENFVEQPFSLSDLGIAISTAMHKVKQESPKIFLDSTAPLFTRLESSNVVEFLQDRGARIKGGHGAFFFTIGEGTISPDLMSKLEEVIDCIIRLNVREVEGKIIRSLRIKKLRGRSFVDSWISFEIKPKRGLVLFPPKGWSKSTK